MNSLAISKKTLLKRLAVAVALLGSTATAASAATVTPFTKIVAVQSGWVVDRMLVFPVGALVNPNGTCPIFTNGYIIKETDPARRTFYDILVNAVLWQRDVSFVVDGCFADRPRIVSVSVRRL